MATIPNPAPHERASFGMTMDALGADRVVVGAPWHPGETASQLGAVHLYAIREVPSGPVTNTATIVSLDQHDRNPNNNSDSVVIKMLPAGADTKPNRSM